MLSFRARRRKTLHLLGNLETGKSKKEFCTSRRFRIGKSCRDKMGQNRTVWDRLGQSGTLSRDCDGATRCHKKPRKATRGHEKQQKATESHKNKRRAETVGDRKLQKATTGNSRRQKATVRDNWRQEERRVLRWLGGIGARERANQIRCGARRVQIGAT